MVLIAQNDYKPIFQVGKVFYLFNFYLLIKYKVVKLYASDFYTALLSGLRNRTVSVSREKFFIWKACTTDCGLALYFSNPCLNV